MKEISLFNYEYYLNNNPFNGLIVEECGIEIPEMHTLINDICEAYPVILKMNCDGLIFLNLIDYYFYERSGNVIDSLSCHVWEFIDEVGTKEEVRLLDYLRDYDEFIIFIDEVQYLSWHEKYYIFQMHYLDKGYNAFKVNDEELKNNPIVRWLLQYSFYRHKYPKDIIKEIQISTEKDDKWYYGILKDGEIMSKEERVKYLDTKKHWDRKRIIDEIIS